MTTGKESEQRRRLAQRIRALRNKTVENGCTEGEALAVAAKASDLMDKHDMSLTDMEMAQSEFRTHEYKAEDDVGHRLWRVAAAISRLTGTRYWTDNADYAQPVIFFFGRDTDVEI